MSTPTPAPAEPTADSTPAPELTDGPPPAEPTPAPTPAPAPPAAPAPAPAPEPAPAPAPEADDEPFDRDRAMEKIRKTNSENKSLRRQLDDLKAQLESRVDPDEAKAAIALVEANAAREVARVKVGHRYGLPEQLIELLKGDTPEEIEAHAKQLAPLIGGGGAALGRGGLDPTEGPVETDPKKLAAKIPRLH